MRNAVVVITMLLWAISASAFPTYTGRSGAPGLETCASSCHGGAVTNTVQVTGFPSAYTPGAAYLLTIKKISGGTIVNFNSSCRVGLSGTANAGAITAGQFTSTYNVSGETNGVHFTSMNHDSGQFTWTAPAAGTGTVRLYAAALQSNVDGNNNTIVLTATEAAALPGIATSPLPTDLSTNVLETVVLSWSAGAGATSHDVYFGPVDPPAFAGNQAAVTFDPVGDLTRGATYFWRVDERNAAGATPGPVWSFTVRPAASVPQHLMAVVEEGGIRLIWEASTNAALYNVYRDTVEVVDPIPANLIGQTATPSYLDIAPTPAKSSYIVTAQ